MDLTRTIRQRLKSSGGVYPPPEKATARAKITPGPVPDTVVIPLQQHVGAPCEPLVEVHDKVTVGQKIGDSSALISAPVHSSVSGEVKAIREHAHPSGRNVLSILIESDGLETPAPGLKPLDEPLGMDPRDIRAAVREGGIVGLGGAVFPTHVKLTPPADKPVETVIVNGAECEPFLTGDYRLMVERGREIIEGARIIRNAVGAERIVVAVEDIHPEAASAMKEAGAGDRVEVAVLPVRYPQGAEKTLVQSILGRQVPSGGLPIDVGAIVDNVATCAAIYDLFYLGMPLVERVLTVAGDGVSSHANLRVKLGTSVGEVIDFCGGTVGETGKVILGGPMMGLAQYTTSVPVTKATNGIIVLRRESILRDEPGQFNCIRCGRCVKHCPMNLLPFQMGAYADQSMWEQLEKFNIEDCMECGCCAYICPTKNPLVQLIKVGKEGSARRKKKMEDLHEARKEAEEQNTLEEEAKCR